MRPVSLIAFLLAAALIRVNSVDQHEFKIAINYDKEAFTLLTNGAGNGGQRIEKMEQRIRNIVSRVNQEMRKANAGVVLVETRDLNSLPPPYNELPGVELLKNAPFQPKEKVDFYQIWTGRRHHNRKMKEYFAVMDTVCSPQASTLR